GCRGFLGPVPPPLLISALQLWAEDNRPAASTTNAEVRSSEPRRIRRQNRTGLSDRMLIAEPSALNAPPRRSALPENGQRLGIDPTCSGDPRVEIVEDQP